MKHVVIDLSTKRNGREVKWQAESKSVENFDELISLCGSADAALEWANGHLATDSGNAGRPIVRDADASVSDTDAISKAQTATRDYVPRGVRAPGVKAKAAAFDELMQRVARGESLSPDELENLAKKFGA